MNKCYVMLRSRSKVIVEVKFKMSFFTDAEWLILVLGFAKYSKKSGETQIRYTLINIIEC